MIGDTSTMSPARAAIVERLQQRPWFQASSPELQMALIGLPDNPEIKDTWNGFLADLADRGDVIGGAQVLRLVALPRGNFAGTPMFEVRNLANGQVYTYEFISWKHGPASGSKGLILIRDEETQLITHFVVLQGEKFATGKQGFDSVGGFGDPGADGVVTLQDRIALEIREELGVSDLAVADIIDLGRLMTDPGMTNNNPGVFCGIVNALQARKISAAPRNPDWRELDAAVLVRPISDLASMVMVNGDTFFLTAVVRAIAAGILPPEVLAPAA